jgi:2-polyprenyl-3-methyl-5-hydroxy-6-metoxy-1,4-benzoquinol methylase
VSDHERVARELNRALWDERVPIHVGSEFYDVAGFLAGTAQILRPFELQELGDVHGLELVHLQCHFGLDTLSWAREGATVTGLDFSGPAMEAARDLAERAGIEASFVQSDVYDAQAALDGRTFDVVYTGLGALNWLGDLERWASVVASLLRPGGRLYLSEFHPITDIFADADLTIVRPYFQDEPTRWDDEPGTYADMSAQTQHNSTIEWTHTVGAVVSAVIAAGLRLEFLHEHPETLFERWPMLQRGEGGIYRLPDDVPSLPLMYSLAAAKP